MKKSSVLTVRLTSDEKKKLESDAASANMQPSQFLRTLINGKEASSYAHQQDISSLLCRIYVSLHKAGFDTDENLMKELQQLCQIL